MQLELLLQVGAEEFGRGSGSQTPTHSSAVYRDEQNQEHGTATARSSVLQQLRVPGRDYRPRQPLLLLKLTLTLVRAELSHLPHHQKPSLHFQHLR